MAENTDDFSSTLERVVTSGDSERVQAFTSLLNSFNFAVQVQGSRTHWEPSDFRAFAIALCAMDKINESVRNKEALRAVEKSLNIGHDEK